MIYTAGTGTAGQQYRHQRHHGRCARPSPGPRPGRDSWPIGDVHASMGDGEVSGTGVEIAGEVTVRVDLVPGAAPARPWIETAEHWITTGSGPSLEDAVEIAVEELTGLLMARLWVQSHRGVPARQRPG